VSFELQFELSRRRRWFCGKWWVFFLCLGGVA